MSGRGEKDVGDTHEIYFGVWRSRVCGCSAGRWNGLMGKRSGVTLVRRHPNRFILTIFVGRFLLRRGGSVADRYEIVGNANISIGWIAI